MSKFKNLNTEILKKKTASKGLLGKERILAEDFEKFSTQKIKDGIKVNPDSVLYSFIYQRQRYEMLQGYETGLKLAAATESASAARNRGKNYFYINADLDSALRIKIKNSNEVTASLITSPQSEFSNPLIHCRETDKYYIPDGKNVFNLGKFEAFKPEHFHFDVLLPVFKIDFAENKGEYIPFFTHSDYELRTVINRNEELLVEMSDDIPHRTAVIQSGAYRDFANVKGKNIKISKALLGSKMSLLFY
ncbi:MAG: hypothetical protein LWX07_06045 [Bacteroidetes bacterium]|nr:hypothetical protein [Bacteroidota bacterium]